MHAVPYFGDQIFNFKAILLDPSDRKGADPMDHKLGAGQTRVTSKLAAVPDDVSRAA